MGFWSVALPLAGAALGALGGKGKQESTTTWGQDPDTVAYMNWLRQFTQGQFAPQLQRMMAALSGDPEALRAISGPSTGFMDPIFNRMRDQAAIRAGEGATAAGAFGGTRHGIAEAMGIRDINEQEAMFGYRAQNDALARALQLMGLGPSYFGLGAQPTGGYQTSSQSMSRNPFLGAAGGALSGASLANFFKGGGGGGGGMGFWGGGADDPSNPNAGGNWSWPTGY